MSFAKSTSQIPFAKKHFQVVGCKWRSCDQFDRLPRVPDREPVQHGGYPLKSTQSSSIKTQYKRFARNALAFIRCSPIADWADSVEVLAGKGETESGYSFAWPIKFYLHSDQSGYKKPTGAGHLAASASNASLILVSYRKTCRSRGAG
jgi:hypothetical protein